MIGMLMMAAAVAVAPVDPEVQKFFDRAESYAVVCNAAAEYRLETGKTDYVSRHVKARDVSDADTLAQFFACIAFDRGFLAGVEKARMVVMENEDDQ